VTAYVKVNAQNGIPVLLKINEAVYNKGSPVTLLSEYQIREHGYVIDSVAKKHFKSLGTPGTQQLVLSEDIQIPFQDRGGMIGFELLPIKDGEIDEVDPVLDIFEITGPKKWVPARFRNGNEEECDISVGYKVSHVEGMIKDLNMETLVKCPNLIEAEDPTCLFAPTWFPDLSFKVASQSKCYATRVKPWH
jgi:hypothetical protein